MAGRILKIYRDGKKAEKATERNIPPGAKGNLETLAEMKKIVQFDSTQPDLGNFIRREIIGRDIKTLDDQILSAFLFCRDGIIYDQEKEGFETVADLWSCMFALNPDYPTGDCAIKSVALATCLSFFRLKPMFVAIGQIHGVDYYNHVFVSAAINGQKTTLDPTPQNFPIGKELGSLRRLEYPIF